MSKKKVVIRQFSLIAFITIIVICLFLYGYIDQYLSFLDQDKFSLRIYTYRISLYWLFKSIFWVLILYTIFSFIQKFLVRLVEKSLSPKKTTTMLLIKGIQIGSYILFFISISKVLGIHWDSFNYLFGTLGLGIGFGLQKIVSNFISGIILMTENSVRIDDIVEFASGETGVVKQIRSRYTVVELFDGKEVLYPNEIFIIEKVTNWTHTHRNLRIKIIIEISYDSDLVLAEKLLYQVAYDNAKVSNYANPLCLVDAFDLNGIKLNLLFWVDMTFYSPIEVKSEVLLSIYSLFKENNIKIPYPQLDLHLISQMKDEIRDEIKNKMR